MKIIKAYACEFCPRATPFITSRAVAAHEIRCFHNPATRSCATCKNLLHSYVPTGQIGEVKDSWSCTANAQLAPLTTFCPVWAKRESYEF